MSDILKRVNNTLTLGCCMPIINQSFANRHSVSALQHWAIVQRDRDVMKKTIAIVTGASGGLGKAFVALLIKENLDEIWCVARNAEKLFELKAAYGDKIIPLSLDLSKQQSIEHIQKMLEEERPSIAYVINNAGIGESLGSYKDLGVEKAYEVIGVNCSAVVGLCTVCMPYMQKGSRIINLSSQSAFQPVPYLNLYAATKVFVRNYTRALNVELKDAGISATAVCCGWTETEMLPKTHNGIAIKYPGLVLPKGVAVKALADAKKGKDMSVYTAYVKYMHVLSKLFPHKAVMRTWVGSIRRYL